MLLDVFSSPGSAFESAFHEPNLSELRVIVLLSSLFLSLILFLLTADPFLAGFMFLINIIQWAVLSSVVWFFEFVHVRRRQRLNSPSFLQSASVASKLWAINIVGYIVIILWILLLPFIGPLSTLLFPLFVLILLLVVLAWLVSSFKMVGFVCKANGFKLLINWVLLLFLNSIISGFVVSLISSLVF